MGHRTPNPARLTDEQRALVEENIGLAYHAIIKLHASNDLLGAAYEGLCQAAMLYDKSKGAFSTYAYLAIARKIQRDMTTNTFRGFSGCWTPINRGQELPKVCRTVSINRKTTLKGSRTDTWEMGDFIPNPANMEDEAIGKVAYDEIMSLATPRQREYLERMMESGKSRYAVEQEMGVSRNSISCAMSNLKRKICQQMPELYKEASAGRINSYRQ